MGSEVIILSSDDEDDDWLLGKSQKRSKIVHADVDVTIIEKLPCSVDATINECDVECIAVADGKSSKDNRMLPQDDDCCILSCDPENGLHVPDFRASDADDIVVVGERGPVACRDFPHARHLCVKFPYATTPHEKHCEQCHCYVCDVLAPCLHWGLGRQSNDHCHAFDKDDKWRKLRTQARSHLMKLSTQLAPVQREHVSQPHARTYTQPSSRLTLTTGYKDCTYSSGSSAVLPPFNQGIPNMSGLSPNWQPYLPSSWGTMPVNGPYGNSAASRGAHVHFMGNPDSTSNRTVRRRRGFSEHRSSVVNIATATMTSQQGSHHRLLPSTPELLRERQDGTHRQGAMSQTSSIPVLQTGICSPTHMASPRQHYQDHRGPVYSAVPHNYAEDRGRATRRASTRPSIPLTNFSTNFTKDLTTLQSYFMEGISGQWLSESTPSDPVMKDTLSTQPAGDSVLKGPSRTAQNREMEPLYNPFEPLEALSLDNAAATLATSQTENTQSNEQGAGNIPLDAEGNKKNTEQPLTEGAGTDGSSLLDQIIADLADFDEVYWKPIEPTIPGFEVQ